MSHSWRRFAIGAKTKDIFNMDYSRAELARIANPRQLCELGKA